MFYNAYFSFSFVGNRRNLVLLLGFLLVSISIKFQPFIFYGFFFFL